MLNGTFPQLSFYYAAVDENCCIINPYLRRVTSSRLSVESLNNLVIWITNNICAATLTVPSAWPKIELFQMGLLESLVYSIVALDCARGCL